MIGLSAKVEKIFPLSPTQEGMLYQSINTADSSVYIGQHVIELEDVDGQFLKKAWQLLINKYMALRTVFIWEELSRSVQAVYKNYDVNWHYIDLRSSSKDAYNWCSEEKNRTFNLAKNPPSRIALLRISSRRYLMVWTRHHLLVDGWSAHLILNDLQRAYAHLTLHLAWESKEKTGFSDYIAWINNQDTRLSEMYWEREFSNKRIDPGLEMIRDSNNHNKGSRRTSILLSRESTNLLIQHAKLSHVTLSTLVHTAWASVLFACNDATRLIFGSTHSGRPVDMVNAERVVGNFINTVPIAVEDRQNVSLLEWMNELQKQIQDSSRHGHISNRKILQAANIDSGTTLFDSIVVFMNYPKESVETQKCKFLDSKYDEHSHYPFALLIVPGETLEVIVIHDRSHIHNELADHLLEKTVSQLKTIPMYVNGSCSKYLNNARPTESELPETPLRVKPNHILNLFLSTLEKFPNSTAVCDSLSKITYQELYYAAANLARLFVEKGGIEAGDKIVVAMPRTVAGITCIWASIFCRASYVPVSPDIPQNRLNSIISRVEARLLLVPDSSIESKCQTIVVDNISIRKNDLKFAVGDLQECVYKIMTSGSSGEAKCISVSHSNLAHSLAARIQFYGTVPEVYGLMSPFAFDSSVAGIFYTATTGGCLALVAEDSMLNPQLLVKELADFGVTIMLTLPSVYRVIVDVPNSILDTQLKTVIVAGEACQSEISTLHFDRYPKTSLVNEYGPTEATVWCCAHRLTDQSRASISNMYLPIGRAIPGVALQILDRYLRPVFRGAVGELFISGSIVTEENGLYPTGDLVSATSDGLIMFRGRQDDQIKVRGHRVSLAEIEAAILTDDSVESCAVIGIDSNSGESIKKLDEALQKLPLADALLMLQEVESGHA